ncbi:LamG domain-containing protein [Neiella sp. HB171785]|uniref:LamG domain-containing protein n=1 Tax=Neiella litorisoli TaxID=2771431 RepID=A0A8J6UQB4_9GAMM|nr:LamG domain-containing protein [Neiella litorisoli]MBD1390752.1 LamG domain-containing protein [Neiella litorisoli]
MSRSEQFAEIAQIADDVCDDCVSQEQLSQLNNLLQGDFAAQEFYYDYIRTHVELKSSADRCMEFVYRRITQAEEFIVRPRAEKLLAQYDQSLPQDRSDKHPNYKLFGALAVLVLVVMALIWLLVGRSASSAAVAEIVQGKLAIVGAQGDIDDNYLIAGFYQTEQGATLKLFDGDTLHLGPNTLIKIFNNREIRAKHGHFMVESSTLPSTLLHRPNYLIQPNGGDIALDLTASTPLLTTGDKTLLNPARWKPTHFWTFEGQSDRIIDAVGSAYGIPSSSTTVKGAVGQAAFFSPNNHAVIEFGSGGGTVAGTGSFAVTDGLTVEALVRPDHFAKLGAQNDIFRNEYADRDARVLLGFRTGDNANVSLVFGLFMLEQGYQELIMPLDGQNGRPTMADITDGNFHHIAATYDVKTGLKVIYINGVPRASLQYPAGSKVISGGAGTTTIGNSATPSLMDTHAFYGAIDEVAFYDFAVPEFTVGLHRENASQGLNYFGLSPSSTKLPRRVKLQLPSNSVVELDKNTGLPRKIIGRDSPQPSAKGRH